jgi:hypothetical protein
MFIAALVVARVKRRVMDEEVRSCFKHRVIHIRLQREPALSGVVPVVVAAPVAVEIKVGDVVKAGARSERLMERRGEAGGDLPIARQIAGSCFGFGISRWYRRRGQSGSRFRCLNFGARQRG